MANIADILDKVPMARIEGFEPKAKAAVAVEEKSPVMEDIPFEPDPVPAKPAKAPVKLALDVEEEDLSSIMGTVPVKMAPAKTAPAKVAPAKAAPAKTTPVKDDDDVFALAESILNG